MNILSRENLDKTIQNLESLVKEHEKEYMAHPRIMGYENGFYSHKERAEDYRIILGYLLELQKLRRVNQGE